MDKCVIYIGDFDLRNQNVQSFLVMNNGKILNQLGYIVAYIGINRNIKNFNELKDNNPLDINPNIYLELPNSLNFIGLLKVNQIKHEIKNFIEKLCKTYNVDCLISYQAPSYAVILSYITEWCKENRIPYIVNCADLPIFDSQPLLKRLIMKLNWKYMQHLNYKTADGVISVSSYIDKYYRKPGRKSVIIPPLFDDYINERITKSNLLPTFLYAGTPFVSLGRAVNVQGMKDRLDKVIDIFLQLSIRGVPYLFNIVGLSKEVYTTCVPRHKELLKNEDKIIFWGRRSHKDTLDYLLQADFMINYRDKNQMTEAGFSTKVVESVSLGTPVVMNSIGDTFKYLEEGLSGFELTDNLEDNLELLGSLCKMSPEQRLALKCSCFNQKVFAVEKYKKTFESFLEQVIY